MWSALIIRSTSSKFLLLSLVLAQRQISSLLNIIFSCKSFSHLCCNVKIPRLATPYCIFCDVTRISYILCSFPIEGSKLACDTGGHFTKYATWPLSRTNPNVGVLNNSLNYYASADLGPYSWNDDSRCRMRYTMLRT